jgi:hypothetical protein
MGTYGVQIKGVLPWLFRLARPAGERDFYPPLTALVSREQNIFTSPYTISRLCVPIAQQPWQAVVSGSPVS